MKNDIERLDGRLLLSFDALMQQRSVSQAAAQMGVTQPAMSVTLRKLRALFNDPLLVRGDGAMVPTPRAQSLVRPIRALLQELRAVAADARPFDPSTSTQTFTLTATEYAGVVLIPALGRYLERHAPGIDIVVRSAGRGEAAAWLESGEIDFRIAWVSEPGRSLHGKTLYSDEFVCLVSADHPVVRESLTVEQFCTLPHVRVTVPNPQLVTAIDKSMQRLGVELRIALTVRDFLLAPHAVVGTRLIATVPRRFAQGIAAQLPVRILRPPISLPRQIISLYWHERMHKSAAHAWLRDVLGSLVKEEPGAPARRRKTGG